MPQKVVIDTNALLLPFESGVRIEPELQRLLGEYEILVPEAVLAELAYLASETKGQRASNARMAMTLASRFAYRQIGGKGDQAVFNLARKEQAILFSNDKGLLALALKHGLRIIRVKGQGHLVLESAQGEDR